MKKLPPKHLRDFKHPLLTRRDFLASGIIGFGAMATVPAFGRLLKPGQRKALDTAAGPIPFMAFDMAGGGSLHGNFLAGKAGGPQDLLAAYDTLGWDPRASGSLNTSFGLPMSAKFSQILTGITTTASAAAQANLRMGSFCHTVTQFDSQVNNLNSTILVLKSGVKGMYVGNGAGVVDSLSGGNSSAVQQNTPYKPVLVNSVADLLASVSFGGAATIGMSAAQLKALAQGGVDLSAAQTALYSGAQGGYSLQVAAAPAYAQSLQLLTSAQGMDPRQDTNAQNIYQIATTTALDDPSAVIASLVTNTVLGNCGPSTWTLGGCDYHTGNSADGDAKDLAMGQQIGMALEYANRAQKPLFFQIITDGSCTAEGGSRDWDADSFANMTIIGYFNPAGAPKYIMDGNNPRYQVGSFTDAQSPDTTTLIGNSPDLVAYAVLANYLNVNGRIADFATYAPGIFTDTQLDSVLIFDTGVGT